MYRDFREMLPREDIDAVLIATGDRWHTMASIYTAKAGKDIYCEKPCSMTIAESQALADTMRRYGRIYQAGTQRRSIANFLFAADLCHTGKLGKLTTVHANTLDPAVSHDWLPAEPEPAMDECDWNLWLGPTPWRPYNAHYIRGGWRGFFDFHGGGILEWGAHTVDLCNWAGTNDTQMPVLYEPTPSGCIATYANGLKLVMRDEGWMGLGTCSVAVRRRRRLGRDRRQRPARILLRPAARRATAVHRSRHIGRQPRARISSTPSRPAGRPTRTPRWWRRATSSATRPTSPGNSADR